MKFVAVLNVVSIQTAMDVLRDKLEFVPVDGISFNVSAARDVIVQVSVDEQFMTETEAADVIRRWSREIPQVTYWAHVRAS